MTLTKFILTAAIGLSVLLVDDCMATGPIPLDTAQSGVLSFNTNGASPLIITNTFSPGFTYPPAMTFFLVSGVTNALPLTNTFITTTNFTVELATPTNCSVAWTAFAGYPRLQFGTNTVAASSLVTNTYSFPYEQLPTVQITGPGTNTAPGIVSQTVSGFVFQAGVAGNYNWQAIGLALTPGKFGVTY